MTTTTDQLSEAAAAALWSVRLSRARIDAALAIRCAEHAAEPGSYCWGSRSSGVRGLCHARYVEGVGGLARSAAAASPGAPREVSRATLDAQTRLSHRHPNRHPITPAKTAVAR